MLYIIFSAGIVAVTYLACMPYRKNAFNIPLNVMLNEFGPYILIGVFIELLLVTLFSTIGGIIGLVGYGIYMFLSIMDTIYSNWD
jgi:hypothetical protein